MHKSLLELERFLEDLARDAQAGDQLPTIRELMRRFGVSQGLVQRAFAALKDRGLIDSQVGRGTYFVGGPAHAAPAPAIAAPAARPAEGRSVLLLRRSISIARGRALVEGLNRRFTADGHRVLEVSYTDAEHALTVLKALPRLDACVVQATFRTVPIELLAALRAKCAALAVDGTALVGADVEAVGTEWGEPLASAFVTLGRRGHRHIAVALTDHPLLATQLGWRRLEHLRQAHPDFTFDAIPLPQLPDGDYAAALVERLHALRQGGHGPTALIAWGIEDGARFRELLAAADLDVPAALSVVLLGRTDLANEHAGFFHTVGCAVEDQVAALHEAVLARWAAPDAPFRIRLTPVTEREGDSVADAPAPAAPRGGRAGAAKRA
jgi:DNA-binding LacI/PurR family transcriptional regulator